MSFTSWDETPKPINSTPSAFPAWDKADKDEVLAHWESLKTSLAKLKEEELAFRKYVVSRAFPTANEGTNTVELNNGYKLKAVVKYNYKLSENKIVEEGLDKLAKIGNNGAFIADRLVSWTPNFLLTEYREIQKQAEEGLLEAKSMLQIIDTFLTITDAAPTLDIVEPKVKK